MSINNLSAINYQSTFR